LKPEWWGSQLVQEKYQEEKACDKRHPYLIIIIIIMQCYIASLMYRNVVQIYIVLTFENFEKKYDFKYVYPNYLHVKG